MKKNDWNDVKADAVAVAFTLVKMFTSGALFLGFLGLTLVIGWGMDALFAAFPNTDAWVVAVAKVIDGALYVMDAVALLYAAAKQFVDHLKGK